MIHNKLTLSISNFTEGCDSNSYHTLDDPTRRSSYKAGTSYCDSLAPKQGTTSPDWKGAGWYRAGNSGSIATQVVTYKHCNTYATGYLASGHHPDEEGKTIPAKICFHGYSTPCWKEMQIQIKKCKGFYLYKLEEVGDCARRFCTT